ncbi:MAG: nucleoside triphosphate pyrophosphatase [Pseudomonadales bacterium]|nr:nucleoside triphosphate pyrophosphatase [Pseudomonadales bacterium]
MSAESTKPLILASASPRRAQLLEQMGLVFSVRVTNVDETPLPGESPAAYVARLAQAKAQAGFEPGAISIGADTTVTIDDEILGKPCGLTEGVDMLLRLAGRRHEVLTGVAVSDGVKTLCEVVGAVVHFGEISTATAERYWYTGEPADKAGGYGIQGIGGIFVQRLEGSYTAVVGLPVERTEHLLRAFNIDTWSTRKDGRRITD